MDDSRIDAPGAAPSPPPVGVAPTPPPVPTAGRGRPGRLFRRTRPRRPWIRATGRVVAPISWIFSAGAAVCLASRYIVSDSQLVVVLTCAVPYAAAASAVLGVAALLTRRWLTALTAVALAVAVGWSPITTIANGLTNPGGPTAVRVMSSNMKLGSADADAMVALVRSGKIDLLMTQEMTPQAEQRLIDAGISTLLPYKFTVPKWGGLGVGLFSRYPLTNTRDYPEYSLGVVTATVALPTGSVTAMSSHLLPPYPYDPVTYNREAGELGSLLNSLPGRVIDSGDFNSTTNFAKLRSLIDTGRVADAATQSGAVFLRTYPSNHGIIPPVIGIDHTLVRGFRATSVTSHDIPGSDHRSIVVKLALGGS